MNSAVLKAVTIVLIYVLGCLPCLATFAIDTTFASPAGKLLVSFPDSSTQYTSQALRVFIQPNDRILVGGSFTNGTPDGQLAGVAWVGLTPGGGLDPGFASGGLFTDWRPDASTSFRDALMYPDGSTLRISQVFRLPVGSSTVQTVRLTSNGGLDNVFGSNVSIGPCCLGFFQARPVQIAARSDGRILALITDEGQYLLYRLNSDGTRDTTFGANGIVGISFNKFPPLNPVEMIPLSDGKTLLVGHVSPLDSPGGLGELFFARLTETGLWDKSFGRNGFVRVPFDSAGTITVRKALLQADGKILLGGNITSSDSDVWMARFRPNGRLDSTFGTNGVVIRDFAPGATDVAQSMALSPDGKIRMVGSINSPMSFLVARFSANGTFEEHTTVAFTAGQNSEAADVALQPDGKLVVAGYTRNPNASITGNVFAITRLTE